MMILFPLVVWWYMTAMIGAFVRSITPWPSYGPTPCTGINTLIGLLVEIGLGYVIYWIITHISIVVI